MRGSIGMGLAIASGLMLLVLAVGCKPNGITLAAGVAATATPTVESDEQKAQRIAIERMRQTIGVSAVERSHIVVRPSKTGWTVVFRNAEAACGDGPFWPGACRFGPTVYRDVYACVERDGWRIRQVGASQSPRSLGPENPCDNLPIGTATVVPEATASPRPTSQGMVVPVDTQQPGGSSATITYVAPEVFPDLATLTASADLIVRGQALDPDRLMITEILVNRLQVDPATVRLRLIQLPPDAPPLLNDPPLVSGKEYILFLRSFWGATSDRFRGGDHTFRPVGGPQGQWTIRDGVVIQQGDVPLKARNGEAVDNFLAEIAAAPDLRAVAAALLTRYGWTPGEPNSVRLQSAPSAAALQSGADVQAWLAASQGIGLDFTPYAGKQVLWLHYSLHPNGVDAWVLMVSDRAMGAWLRAGKYALVFHLDQRDEALAAAADPTMKPTPTPDPRPIGDRANLARYFRLAEARDIWVKGAVRGGLVRDAELQAKLLAALDVEVGVARIGRELIPVDDPRTIVIVFATDEEIDENGVAFRYHVDQRRVYVAEKGIVFAAPSAFVIALEPLLVPVPTPAAPATPIEPRPTTAPARPTEAPVLPSANVLPVEGPMPASSRLDPILSHPGLAEFTRQYPDGWEQ